MEEPALNLRAALQKLKFEVIHQFIEHTANQLWLHAGAVSRDGKGVLLCGTWGKGKSTLVSALCALGWKYLSDDIVPVGITSRELHPFHLTPMKRTHANERSRESIYTSGSFRTLKNASNPGRPRICKGHGPVIWVCFSPDYSPSAEMQLAPCSPAEATMILLENCLNLKTLKQTAIQCIAGIVESVPVYRVPYTEGGGRSSVDR